MESHIVLVVDVITTVADGITTNWLMLLPCSSWNTKLLTASISFIIFVADGITTCLADVIANYIVADGITTWLMLLPIWQMV